MLDNNKGEDEMSMKKKMRTASQIIQRDGLYGVPMHIWNKLNWYTFHSELARYIWEELPKKLNWYIFHSERAIYIWEKLLNWYAFHSEGEAEDGFEEDIFGTEPIFRYAACNDLIQLMARYPQYCLFVILVQRIRYMGHIVIYS